MRYVFYLGFIFSQSIMAMGNKSLIPGNTRMFKDTAQTLNQVTPEKNVPMSDMQDQQEKEYQEEQEREKRDWEETKKHDEFQDNAKEENDERFNLNEDQNRTQFHP